MKTEDPAGTVRFRLMAPQMQYLPEAEVDAVYCAHALGETYTDPTNPARQFDKQRCAWEYDGSVTATCHRASRSAPPRRAALRPNASCRGWFCRLPAATASRTRSPKRPRSR